MSKIIPQRTVDVLRQQANVSISNYGIDCDLYIPSNVGAVQYKDVYSTPSDYVFVHYQTLVWIEWSPNIYRLRQLGLFAEKELPIIARFQTEAQADDDTIRMIDIIVRSYFKIPIQHVPASIAKTDEFEVIDVLTDRMHDAVINQVYKCAPRRTK